MSKSNAEHNYAVVSGEYNFLVGVYDEVKEAVRHMGPKDALFGRLELAAQPAYFEPQMATLAASGPEDRALHMARLRAELEELEAIQAAEKDAEKAQEDEAEPHHPEPGDETP